MSNNNLTNEVHIELIELILHEKNKGIDLMTRSILYNCNGNMENIHLYSNKKILYEREEKKEEKKDGEEYLKIEINGMIGDPSNNIISSRENIFPLIPKKMFIWEIPKEDVKHYLNNILPQFIEGGYQLERTVLEGKANNLRIVIEKSRKRQVYFSLDPKEDSKNCIQNYQEISDFCIKHKLRTL